MIRPGDLMLLKEGDPIWYDFRDAGRSYEVDTVAPGTFAVWLGFVIFRYDDWDEKEYAQLLIGSRLAFADSDLVRHNHMAVERFV